MRRLRLLALPCLAVAAIASPLTASASCAAAPDVAAAVQQASIVFVGTVTAVDQSQVATVDVQEIWKGPNVSDPTTIAATSVDSPTWKVGTRYLFFPSVDADGSFVDNGCSPTSVYQPAFDALRPANAHPPQGPPTSGVPGSPPIAAIFLAILVLGSLGAFVLYRSGRSPIS